MGLTDVMDVIPISPKDPYIGTLEKFYNFRETKMSTK